MNSIADFVQGDNYYNKELYAEAKECYERAKRTVTQEDSVLQLDANIISCTIRQALKNKDKFLKTIGATKLHELNGECKRIALKIKELKEAKLSIPKKIENQNKNNTLAIQDAICANSYNEAMDLQNTVDYADVKSCKIILDLLKTAESLYRSNLKINDADVTLQLIAEVLENCGDALSEDEDYKEALDFYLEALQFSQQLKKPIEKQRELFLSAFLTYENCAEQQQAVYDIYQKMSMETLMADASYDDKVELSYAAYRLEREKGQNSLSWAKQVLENARQCSDVKVYEKEIDECRNALTYGPFNKACHTFSDNEHFNQFKASIALKALQQFTINLIKQKECSPPMVKLVKNLSLAIKALNPSDPSLEIEDEEDDSTTNPFENIPPKEIYTKLSKNFVALLKTFFSNNKEKVGEALANLCLEIGKAFVPKNLIETDFQSADTFLAAAAISNRQAALLLKTIHSEDFLKQVLETFANSSDFTFDKAQDILKRLKNETDHTQLKIYVETTSSHLDENGHAKEHYRAYFNTFLEQYLTLLKENTESNDFHKMRFDIIYLIKDELENSISRPSKRRKITSDD